MDFDKINQQNLTSPAKHLLDSTGSPMDSATLFKALSIAGLVEQLTYLSSTGSGEIKKYWAFTPSGLKYGVNQSTMSPTKTELRFYDTHFSNVLIAAAEAIISHARNLS
ncbi:hypothetical protein [Methylobacter tundripaludum]|uniref:hypothetical protein n=1 Tax=Methylobacter tundripaludum TaxID=173365 RepID=UPI000CEAC968|nr:hypothetical protein [Methylobacter tundripaludum]